jgi:hypothetical protein
MISTSAKITNPGPKRGQSRKNGVGNVNRPHGDSAAQFPAPTRPGKAVQKVEAGV